MDEDGGIIFTLQGQELAVAQAWQRQHLTDHQCEPLSAGERFTDSFTPSGLGTLVRVACVRCGMEQSVTDDECW
jgi:hypothetical protein